MLRAAGAVGRRLAPAHLAGGAAARSRAATCASSRTCPTRRRSWPRRSSSAAPCACRAGRRSTTQPGGLLPGFLERMGGADEPRTATSCRSPAPARSAASTSTCTPPASSPPRSPPCAVLADSPTRLRGIAHLRGHETDRLAALAAEITRARRAGRADRRRPGHHARARCSGGTWRSYDDHRMATAGALIGLRVPGRRGRGRRDDGQDDPRLRRAVVRDARRRDGLMARAAATTSDDVRVRPGRGSRPRTKQRPEHADAVPALVDGRRPRPVHRPGRPRRAARAPHDRDEGTRARPRPRRRRRPRGPGRRLVGRRRQPGPHRAHHGAPHGAAPHRRRHRPDRARHRRQRRPARHRHRAGRSRAAHRA